MGLPELTILLVISMFSIIPIAVAIWALYTLSKVRATVDRIEQLLRAR